MSALRGDDVSCQNGQDIWTGTAYSICGSTKRAITSSRRLSRSLTHRPAFTSGMQYKVRSWEYGKQLKRSLLSAPLRRLTHEDSTQLMYLRYRHHSKLYSSKNGDGSRCQRRGPCSRQWMTSMRSVRWTKLEEPISPLLQRRVSICAISILCPSRGESTLPEKQLAAVLTPGRA